MEARETLVDAFRCSCEQAGFDLVTPLRVGDYNARVSGALRLEDFGCGAHLALVVGNTRALWPRLLDALESDARLAAEAHPLERYTERSIRSAARRLSVPFSLRWSHEGGDRLVAMQRLAHVAGLAYLSESHLSVHPTYGPWIGLRAALSLPVPGPESPAPELSHPCGGCAGRCWPAFEHGLEVTTGRGEGQGPLTSEGAERDWQLWLACRDACPTGREHRYSDAQIRYHYTKDRRQLGRLASGPEDG
jgi:methylmalonic aciduria homocystinuria type C protein